MNTPRAVGVYRELMRFYPRRFRDEYGADMTLLFRDQLRDEPASRVWVRGVIDLAITIPAQHLETHMHRPRNPAVPLVYAAISLSGATFAVVVGSNLAIAGIGLAVAVVAGVVAAVSWRHARTLTAARPATAHWWQVLAGGASMLAIVIVVANAFSELPDGWWGPLMLTLLSGIVTTAAGLLLGLAHLTSSRSLHWRRP